jgi:hypothetical protein
MLNKKCLENTGRSTSFAVATSTNAAGSSDPENEHAGRSGPTRNRLISGLKIFRVDGVGMGVGSFKIKSIV